MKDQRPGIEHLVRQMQTLALFAALDGDTLERLATASRWKRYESGEIVVREGQSAPGFYYLESGWLKVTKSSPAGREQILRFLEPGDTFNEIGVFTDQPTPASVVVLSPAEVWWIPRRVLVGLVRESPDFAEHVISKMAENVLHLVSLVADISLRTVGGRLARLILDDAIEGVLHRPRWYTQSELAARLGTVTDVVQRALRDLETRQLIKVDRESILVRDPRGLAEIASH